MFNIYYEFFVIFERSLISFLDFDFVGFSGYAPECSFSPGGTWPYGLQLGVATGLWVPMFFDTNASGLLIDIGQHSLCLC